MEKAKPNIMGVDPAGMGANAALEDDEFSRAVQRRLRNLRVAGRTLTFVGVLLLILVALFALAVAVVPRLLGLHAYAMVSGSMDPAYPTGSLVYAESVKPEDLSVGDVAVFWRNDDIVIHRVEEINAVAGEMITRGDANEGIDAHPALFENVVGRAKHMVPNIGYFLMSLSTLPGKLVLGWIVLMGVLIAIVGTVVAGLAKS